MSVSFEDILVDMGINPALKGFKALEKLCELREENPEAKYTEDLLPRVAEMVGSPSRYSVERRCRHAIIRALDDGMGELMEKVLRQPADIMGGFELSRFVELCIIAKRRFNYDGGEI